MCICVHIWILDPLRASTSTWAALERGSVFTVLLPGRTRKCMNTHTHTHLTEPGAWSDHLSGRRWAEEAHQGLTREDQRAHYHASPLRLTLSPFLSLPLTSNKRPAGCLSLCLLGGDNRTCPEPKEMNYLPRSLLYSWRKKIKSLFLYYHWTHGPCITHKPCSVASDVKCSE